MTLKINTDPIYTARWQSHWAANPTSVRDFPTEDEAIACAKVWEAKATLDDVIYVERNIYNPDTLYPASRFEVKLIYRCKIGMQRNPR